MSATVDDVYARAVEQYGEDKVGVEELGTVYETILATKDRRLKGAWYTPRALADPITRFSLTQAISQVGPSPVDLLRVVVFDPACGAGVFLCEAARQLSTEYARRLVGGDTLAGELVLAVMPFVILNCIHGQDVDPVAVDVARMALWLETARTLTPAMLSRHVTCGDTLAGDTPPAMDDRTGHPCQEDAGDVVEQLGGEALWTTGS